MKSRALQQLNQHSCDDGSLLQTLPRAAAVAHRPAQHCHIPCLSTVDGAQHHERSQSQVGAHKAGNSTDWTSQHSTWPIVCKGLSSENKSKVRLLPTEHCSWNYQARSQMRWRQLVLWVWWISWWHKHHKQEKLPTSFTDRFGIDQKTSKKEVIAPLPSPRRKLCLENEGGNAENIYLVFPEEALGTHKHLDFHALVPWCNRCWWNALLLSLFEPAAHQNHTKPYKTKHLVTNQGPHSSASSTKQSRRGHLIFSLPLLISIQVKPIYLLNNLTFPTSGKPPSPSQLLVMFQKEQGTCTVPLKLGFPDTVHDQCSKQELWLESVLISPCSPSPFPQWHKQSISSEVPSLSHSC